VRVLLDPAGHPFCLYTEGHTQDNHTQDHAGDRTESRTDPRR
jgi:hypothetical protein